jgi:hypothetical protein
MRLRGKLNFFRFFQRGTSRSHVPWGYDATSHCP